MKYEQPYGVSDPNAAYINGNPATGTMGSIPPAASIENPQREIVNTIADTGLIVPSDADLHQLAKAIQSGQLNFKHDTGVANAYAATLVPSPGPYFEGLSVILKVGAANTGPSVLNLNALGNAPIARSDGTALLGGEMVPGAYVNLLYDGTKFRMVWAQSVGAGASPTTPGMPVWMTAPRDFYVNNNTGNDAYDGTSATFVSGVKGPFKTLQRAAYEYPKYNLNGYVLSIHVADGPYTQVSCGPANGSGEIRWIGNPGSPPNVAIQSPSGSAVIVASAGAPMTFNGFAFASNAATYGDPAWGIYAVAGASVALFASQFWQNVEGHVAAAEALITVNGPITIQGNTKYAFGADSGRINLNPNAPPALIMPVGLYMSAAFYMGTNMGRLIGPWGSISGANNVNGPKYSAQLNSIINTWGQGSASIPGNQAGVLGTGGQIF
jgi:hypothetical protein